MGILSQNTLSITNAGEKVINHVLEYNCCHGKNVNNMFLTGCTVNQKSIKLLAESLKRTCENKVQLALCNCKLEDTHIYQFQNALQYEYDRLNVVMLDLSNNHLKSPNIIKLACLFYVEELCLTNNQLRIEDTTLIAEVLADENFYASYIDLQNNLIFNVEDTCKKAFLTNNFNYNLIGVGHGCIITKGYTFKIQHGMRVNSLFFAFTETLTDQDFLDFFLRINSSEIVEVNRLYIAMLQCKSWYDISERIQFLTVLDELYLCVPDMDITTLDFFWQYQCKSKVIVSKDGLKAIHVKDSETLCKSFDYVNVYSKVIILEDSNVCCNTMAKLAGTLSNNGNDKRWDVFKLYNCGISDDHIRHFYEMFSQCKKHGKIAIKHVNLSKNKISQNCIGIINQLLEEWKSEELMIAENNLQNSGLLLLLRNNYISMNMYVLDTHQNKENINFSKEIQLCESFIYNKRTTFAHLTNRVLIVDGSIFIDVNNYEIRLKTDVTGIYLKFDTLKQDKALLNIEKYLLSLDSLEVLFITISGNIIDNRFLKLIKKISVTDKLIISAEDMSEIIFKPIIKHIHYELSCTTCISSRESLYIANSDKNMFQQLFNYTCINRSCQLATCISITNCNNISNDSIKIVANGLTHANRKEKDIRLLEINNSSLVHGHIHEICTALTDKLTSINSTVSLRVLDLSNNYLDANCMEDLIQMVSILHIEDLLLNNNQLQEDGIKQIMKVLTDSNSHLNYIDLQNNCINNMENYFEKIFFFHDFSFSIITTNDGCIVTKSRFSCLNMRHAVNCLYLAIREGLADPDLQELSQTLTPPTRINRLYIAVLQSTSLYHILNTIERLTMLVSEMLYLCIPEMVSSIADRLWKYQCKSKLILSRKMLHGENVKSSEVIFKTLDYINADLEVIAIDKSSLCHKTIKKLASVLSNYNHIKIWQRFKLCWCNITDDHVKCFFEEGKTSSNVHIKSVNLSSNEISSSGLEMIVKLVKQWQSERLLMAGNKIQCDGLRTLLDVITTNEDIHINNNQLQESVTDNDNTHFVNPLKTNSCCLKYIDLQNNQVQNANIICKEYFFIADCNFIFATTRNGIIITKELSFSVQPTQEVDSFYLVIREVLSDKGLQNLVQLINMFPTDVNNLYISTLLLNQNFSHLIQAVNCIEAVNDELYLCAPEMDSSSVNAFWQHQCNSKLILSRQCLQATHVKDSKVLCKTLDCVTTAVDVISLQYSSLSDTVMRKLASVVSNHGNGKTWEILKICHCNITDDNMQCFYEHLTQFQNCGEMQIKSVNLSHNSISSFAIRKVVDLLELWKSEELIIAGNNIQYAGLLELVNAERINVHTLDSRQSNVQPEDIKQMCEEKTFNRSFKFKFAHLTNGILLIDASVLNSPHYPVCDDRIISGISSIYIKSTPNQEENIQKFVSSFQHLKNLFIVMQGDTVFSDCFIKIIKSIKTFTLYAENMSDINLEKFKEPSNLIAILLRQKLYIKSSGDKKLNKMLSNMIHHCENMINISIHRCNMNSRSFKLLAKGLMNTSKNVAGISIDYCKVEDRHIEKLQEMLNASDQQVTGESLTVKKLQISNNCVKSLCVIKLVNLLQIEELHLNNNNIQGSNVLETLQDENCHLK